MFFTRQAGIRLLLALSFSTVGCVNMQMYFTPKLNRVANADLPKVEERKKVRLDLVWEINGVPDPKQAARVRGEVAGALERTKVFDVVDKSDDSIVAKVTETYDEANTYAKAKAAGETFGAAGSISDSKMTWKFDYRPAFGRIVTTGGETTMHMILGNRSVPKDYEPVGLMSGQRGMLDAFVRPLAVTVVQQGAVR